MKITYPFALAVLLAGCQTVSLPRYAVVVTSRPQVHKRQVTLPALPPHWDKKRDVTVYDLHLTNWNGQTISVPQVSEALVDRINTNQVYTFMVQRCFIHSGRRPSEPHHYLQVVKVEQQGVVIYKLGDKRKDL